MVYDWQKAQEDQEDQRHDEKIAARVEQAKICLKDDEQYFLPEIIKMIHIDNQQNVKNIRKVVYDFLTTDEHSYLKKIEAYQSYA